MKEHIPLKWHGRFGLVRVAVGVYTDKDGKKGVVVTGLTPAWDRARKVQDGVLSVVQAGISLFHKTATIQPTLTIKGHLKEGSFVEGRVIR